MKWRRKRERHEDKWRSERLWRWWTGTISITIIYFIFSSSFSLSCRFKNFPLLCVCEQCKKFWLDDEKELNRLEPFAVTFHYFYEEEFTAVKTDGILLLDMPFIHRTSYFDKLSWEVSIHLIKYSNWMIRLTQSVASHTENW